MVRNIYKSINTFIQQQTISHLKAGNDKKDNHEHHGNHPGCYKVSTEITLVFLAMPASCTAEVSQISQTDCL